MLDSFKSQYGQIFEEALIQEMLAIATVKTLPGGYQLVDIGDYIKYMPLIISGAVKVLREDENGNELLLYYIEKGDTCSISMTNCLGGRKSEVRAIAEVETTLMMVPLTKVEGWASRYKTWLRFVLDSYHNRINDLFHTIDHIAFEKMDKRLEGYLKEKARVNNNTVIQITHQQIAQDLHTSRVVISRLLKQLEKLGVIEVQRSHLEILNL